MHTRNWKRLKILFIRIAERFISFTVNIYIHMSQVIKFKDKHFGRLIGWQIDRWPLIFHTSLNAQFSSALPHLFWICPVTFLGHETTINVLKAEPLKGRKCFFLLLLSSSSRSSSPCPGPSRPLPLQLLCSCLKYMHELT